MLPAAPKVSVLMLAYNHGAYIRQAVESVLRQQTTFSVEIVIGEDCSTDDTRSVLLEMAREHPGRLQLHPRERNLGANANFAETMAACRGEFVALLEGDDHWLGTEKLQRQVDFLQAHPDCVLCFHDVIVADERVSAQPSGRYCDPKPPAFATLDDLLVGNFLPTCSVMYRRRLLPPLSPALQRLPMQDWPSWVLLARAGRLAYLDEVWGCYRRHAGGSWSSQKNERQLRNVLRFYGALYPVLGRAYHHRIAAAEKSILSTLVDLLVHEGRWRAARRPATRYLTLAPGRFRPPPGRLGLYYRLVLGLPSPVMRQLGPMGGSEIR